MTEETCIKGSCHCGNIQYEFTSKLETGSLPVRTCSCSFCTRQGNRYTSDPEGTLEVTYNNPDRVSEYRFGSGTVDFVFCKNCGVMPFAKLETAGRIFGLVNVNTAEGGFDTSNDQLCDYSSETVEDSLKRRRKNWIGQVTIQTQD